AVSIHNLSLVLFVHLFGCPTCPISPSRFQKACCSLQICRSPFFDMSTCHLGYLLRI
uniref:Uncharacterized protein n=2 Tax=Haplochromini TaxID=319058 RepID=A0A3Q2VD38_HAPBU